MSAESESRLRTVTPLASNHDDAPMNAIGWVMFILIGVALLPLLPIFAVLWVVSKLLG